ncbi:D-aspartate oxidase-like isoform X2 [Artemia franciscana]
MSEIAVLGAGVVGLTTAVLLQSEIPDAKITVVADKFTIDTLSDGAAGIFRPGTSFSGPNPEITRQWLFDSYQHYYKIYKSSEAAKAGVIEASGYVYSKEFPEITKNHFLEGLLPVYRPATPSELKLCPGDWKYGAFFTTLVIESRYHLPWLTNKFEKAGGKVVIRNVERLDELAGQFDAAVNCTGFGAKKLCMDNKLVPIRGQVYKVKAPWVKMFFYGDYDTYIIPGVDYVTLGGSRHFDSYRKDWDDHDGAGILERCYEILPNLKQAEIVRKWSGLRPHRDPVRVEKEVLQVGNSTLKVVHNYGHGGYGVTTAPGTSKYAVALVKEFLENKISSKL